MRGKINYQFNEMLEKFIPKWSICLCCFPQRFIGVEKKLFKIGYKGYTDCFNNIFIFMKTKSRATIGAQLHQARVGTCLHIISIKFYVKYASNEMFIFSYFLTFFFKNQKENSYSVRLIFFKKAVKDQIIALKNRKMNFI